MDKWAKVLPVCNKLMMIWVENKKFCEFQQYFSAQEFRASHHGGHETDPKTLPDTSYHLCNPADLRPEESKAAHFVK